MLFNLMADAVGVSAGSLDWNESGEEPMTTPEHFEPQQCCSYDGGEGGSQVSYALAYSTRERLQPPPLACET